MIAFNFFGIQQEKIYEKNESYHKKKSHFNFTLFPLPFMQSYQTATGSIVYIDNLNNLRLESNHHKLFHTTPGKIDSLVSSGSLRPIR